jgi:hypothetical protein
MGAFHQRWISFGIVSKATVFFFFLNQSYVIIHSATLPLLITVHQRRHVTQQNVMRSSQFRMRILLSCSYIKKGRKKTCKAIMISQSINNNQ